MKRITSTTRGDSFGREIDTLVYEVDAGTAAYLRARKFRSYARTVCLLATIFLYLYISGSVPFVSASDSKGVNRTLLALLIICALTLVVYLVSLLRVMYIRWTYDVKLPFLPSSSMYTILHIGIVLSVTTSALGVGFTLYANYFHGRPGFPKAGKITVSVVFAIVVVVILAGELALRCFRRPAFVGWTEANTERKRDSTNGSDSDKDEEEGAMSPEEFIRAFRE